MRIRKHISFLLVAIWICVPAISAQIVPAADRDVDRFREQAFVSYNPRYAELRAERIRRAVSLRETSLSDGGERGEHRLRASNLNRD